MINIPFTCYTFCCDCCVVGQIHLFDFLIRKKIYFDWPLALGKQTSCCLWHLVIDTQTHTQMLVKNGYWRLIHSFLNKFINRPDFFYLNLNSKMDYQLERIGKFSNQQIPFFLYQWVVYGIYFNSNQIKCI